MGGRWVYAWVLAASLAASLGCGPIEYVNQVTRKASSEVEAARAAQADKYSPYYYTLATEYLHQARVEAAAADFQAANRFGRRAEAAAKKARAEAIERVGKPVEQFHPNVVPRDGDGDSDARTPAPANPDGGGGIAPLVEGDDEEPLAPADGEDGEDGEIPAGLGGDE